MTICILVEKLTGKNEYWCGVHHFILNAYPLSCCHPQQRFNNVLGRRTHRQWSDTISSKWTCTCRSTNLLKLGHSASLTFVLLGSETYDPLTGGFICPYFSNIWMWVSYLPRAVSFLASITPPIQWTLTRANLCFPRDFKLQHWSWLLSTM